MAPPRREISTTAITPDILRRAFHVSTIDGKKRVKCVHCNYRHSAENISRQRSHLVNCRGFITSLPEEFRDNHASSSSQMTLTASGIAEGKKSQTDLDNAMGMAVFAGAIPLSQLTSEAMRALISSLNPEYSVPETTKIMQTILPNCYATLRNEVFETLSRTEYLNVTIDERIDITRTMNIFVADSKRYYFVAMRDLDAGAANSEHIADWVTSELRNLSSGDFSRINSITTTSGGVADSLWRILRRRNEIKNAFLFGGDSHGLQHLEDDILSLPSVNKTFKNSLRIMRYFYKEPLQLSILRQIQRQEGGKEYPLVGSWLTYQTSQYHMFLSLKKNYAALVQYARGNFCKYKVKEVIRSMEFWDNIDRLVSILKTIQEHIEASEAVSAHAGDLLQRWVDASKYLNTCRDVAVLGDDIASYLDLKFQDRMHQQVQDAHWAAYFLNPTTINEQIPASVQQKIFELIQRHCENPQEAILQFAHYRAAAGEFYQAYSWNYKDQPKHFWLIQKSTRRPSSDLANLALRLFHTTATSTPSERAFSAMNLQLTLPRYGITAAQTDMVTFIYLNQRALQERPDEKEEDEEGYEQLTREDELISRAWGMLRLMLEDQSEDEAQSEDEMESEYKAALVQTA